jgi:hypothetical protein
MKTAENRFHLTVGSTMAEPTQDKGEFGFQMVCRLAIFPPFAERFQKVWVATVSGTCHATQMCHIHMFSGGLFKRVTDSIRNPHQTDTIIDNCGVCYVFRHNLFS